MSTVEHELNSMQEKLILFLKYKTLIKARISLLLDSYYLNSAFMD